MSESPYNPLEKRHLAENVAEALIERPRSPLPPPERFEGAGVYAIYYLGDFKPYRALTKINEDDENLDVPIYVGKAIPPGSRRGGFGLDTPPGEALYRRLAEHASSLDEVDIDSKRCFCRYLVVDDIWIPLAESMLIEKFSPIWNRLLDGFGNHDPGAGRRNQKRSPWDAVHPGRSWAERLQPAQRTADEYRADIAAFVKANVDAWRKPPGGKREGAPTGRARRDR